MTDHVALVVADDLTGAADTGNEFARRGYETVVVFGDSGGDPPNAAVVVVNTDSRYLPAERAADRVTRAVREIPASVVYKKVDSTLRGNLASEIDAAITATDADLAIVAPAFPGNDRVTACGHHLVEGELVTATAAGQDPDGPVPTSHLPTLLSRSDNRVVSLPIETVAQGATAVEAFLKEAWHEADGPVLVACDATHERHLAAIANGTGATDLSAVFVGSAGLAHHVPLPAEATEPARPDQTDGRPVTAKRVLGVAGSASPVTLEQVATLPAERVHRLEASLAATDPDAAAREAADRCAAAFRDTPVVLLTSVTEAADVEVALEAGRAAGVPEPQVRHRVADALAGAVTRLHRDAPLSGLFLTGGAVAGAVLGALDAHGVRLTGDAVEDGIPVGTVVGGAADGLPVVTKAGAFGERTTVNACLAHLRGENGR